MNSVVLSDLECAVLVLFVALLSVPPVQWRQRYVCAKHGTVDVAVEQMSVLVSNVYR